MESLSQRGEKEIGMGEGGCGLCEGINEEDGGEKKDNEGSFTGNKKRKEYIEDEEEGVLGEFSMFDNL